MRLVGQISQRRPGRPKGSRNKQKLSLELERSTRLSSEKIVWQECAPTHLIKNSSPTSTRVFDTFWRFALERQNLFFGRYEGKAFDEWTSDPILFRYRFTNVYRASDRVSQYLIRNVIYEGDQSASELFFRIILFKLFNKIETWELLKCPSRKKLIRLNRL